jgi:hypothetical protein
VFGVEESEKTQDVQLGYASKWYDQLEALTDWIVIKWHRARASSRSGSTHTKNAV